MIELMYWKKAPGLSTQVSHNQGMQAQIPTLLGKSINSSSLAKTAWATKRILLPIYDQKSGQ